MTALEELIGRLGAAKDALRAGMAGALRCAGAGDQAAATLVAGAARMAGLSNAAALLCRYGRGAESLSLVKSMVVTALAMCWAAEAEDLGQELGRETKALQSWEPDAAAEPAADRLDESGLTDPEVEAADAVLRRMGVTQREAAPGTGPTPEEILAAAHRAMTAALWAMEKRWPASVSAQISYHGANGSRKGASGRRDKSGGKS